MSANIICDDCGKDISTLGDQGIHCTYCYEELKDKISDFEDKVFDLEEQIEKLKNELNAQGEDREG